MQKLIKFSAVAMLICASTAWADYVATGPIQGHVCRGFGIEFCGTHTISAVKGDDGRLFEVATRYADVTEYKERSGRCSIKTKSTGGGLISWGINSVKQPVFLEKDPSGGYKELDVEYLTFKCERR